MTNIRLLWREPATEDEQERTLPLPVTLGRDPENTITLASREVSARHATIREENQRLFLEDLQSRNGTWLNGIQIQQTDVTFGDTIQIGPYQFSLQRDISDVRLRLDWTSEDGQAKFAIQRLPLIIGRDAQTSQVVLPSNDVSRSHARIEMRENDIFITDLQSRNGTFFAGQRISEAVLPVGGVVQIGPFALRLTLESAARRRQTGESTIVFADQQNYELPEAPAAAPVAAGQQQPPRPSSNWPPPLFQHDVVPVNSLMQLSIPLEMTDYVAVGGGLGSFTWVDHLRIYGASTEQILVLGAGADPEPSTTQRYGEHYSRCRPYGKYQRLCINSQIPQHERLRSNSESCPDNIWGWPGYAAREIWHDALHGKLGNAIRIGWQIFGEPIWTNTYTPKSGNVFVSLDREAQRIGWEHMFRFGYARAIRKTDDGRYVIAYTRLHKNTKVRAFVVAKYVHLAVGYPALRFLNRFREYRDNTGDFKSVVNAYEYHDHVYEHLRQHGGVVLLQGRGIVASRLIQRIWELRHQNPNITLLHLMRSPIPEGQRYGRSQRPVHNHIELQPFNWPRACWSGDLRFLLERATPDQRDQLITDWGGTTTADRQDWVDIIEQGKREGWYAVLFGEIDQLEKTDKGLLRVTIASRLIPNGTIQYDTNYVLDATGLENKTSASPLLDDMIKRYNLPPNPKGRLHVENDFEIAGMRNGSGRVYAAGATTLGGPYAAVDSFLGLQYASQRATDALALQRAPGLRYLAGPSVFVQWLKWAGGMQP